MEQPVTTNPVIIMLINMTIVFAVLAGLSFVIRLIHYVDPTKEAKQKQPQDVRIPEPSESESAASSQGQPVRAAEDGCSISEETVAVIAAAITAAGYDHVRIQAIRPIPNAGWTDSAREAGMKRLQNIKR